MEADAIISGNWSAKQPFTSWSMGIHEANGNLTGRAAQISILGDIMEYTFFGHLAGNAAYIKLAYTRNPNIHAYLDLHLEGDLLFGDIIENDMIAYPIQFSRLVAKEANTASHL